MSLLLALQGGALITGDLAATEAQDVAAFAGKRVPNGDLAATESQDAAAISGKLVLSGDLAAVEAQDVAAFTGEVVTTTVALPAPVGYPTYVKRGKSAKEKVDELFTVEGYLGATEARDTAAFRGVVEGAEQGDEELVSNVVELRALLKKAEAAIDEDDEEILLMAA